MKHYNFSEQFRVLYDKAVRLYAAGQSGAETFFTATETAFLTANGLTAQNLYDYAEDQIDSDEPGFDRALAIEFVRRDYFLNVQQGKPSKQVLDPTTMPDKTDEVHGISWLPRIIPKTKAKLRGELPSKLMYSCGGDRGFFMEHNIHPAEFLSLVWRHENDDQAIIDWVVRRSRTK